MEKEQNNDKSPLSRQIVEAAIKSMELKLDPWGDIIYPQTLNDGYFLIGPGKIKKKGETNMNITKKLSNFKDITLFSKTKKVLIKKKKKDNTLHMVLITENQKENCSIKLPTILVKELKKYIGDFEEFYIYNEGMSNKDVRERVSLIFSKYLDNKNKEDHIFVKKMLYISFILVNIKRSKRINLEKDIFEKFKLKEDKNSLLKLYDILKFTSDVKHPKRYSNCINYIFGLK